MILKDKMEHIDEPIIIGPNQIAELIDGRLGLTDSINAIHDAGKGVIVPRRFR